ncbi:AAA-domain-containing protein [Fomitiporia mediterranea MF3/22]|uniref:AAA-domain-containing protein n=1 Tax=Fomitiporia mediterranea (strain MF3/22) TaxID=694068 RepID=UPI000440780A|nr:AAA-domain-containing protein [Fomitiporia mediterranea MF3/22]EJD01058.1 AAA-domain-containing protein [Fomitiporia mediterranea MF3/22]
MNGDITMIHDAAAVSTVDNSIWPVHIEVRLVQRTSMPFDSIRKLVHQYLSNNNVSLFMPSVLSGWESSSILRDSVEKITVSESACSYQSLPIERCSLQIHVYQPKKDSAYEKLSMNPSDANEEYTAGSVSELPSNELEGLWESLFYDGDVKSRLLNYIYATIGFSDADVDHNLVSWNRVILLHGPPGTGKTSLCRALAQKLSIRLKDRYSNTYLFEINSHSLFSRWFSESGKLVQNLFSTVTEMAKEEDDFVVLLIDEIESLTSARSNALSGNEPSDALRVVNALLTQIDRLKYQKNVLIMATSNLAKAIDSAFIDRADVMQYIDYPPAIAIYDILRSCLLELMSKGVIEELDVPTAADAILAYKVNEDDPNTTGVQDAVQNLQDLSLGMIHDSKELSRFLGSRLYDIAEKCKGMSGRSLRRLPVLAHARYIGLTPMSKPRSKPNGASGDKARPQTVRSSSAKIPPTSIKTWLNAMKKVVDDETSNRQRFQC